MSIDERFERSSSEPPRSDGDKRLAALEEQVRQLRDQLAASESSDLYQNLLSLGTKLRNLSTRMRDVVKETAQSVETLDARLSQLEGRLEAMERRCTTLDQQVESLGGWDGLLQKIRAIDCDGHTRNWEAQLRSAREELARTADEEARRLREVQMRAAADLESGRQRLDGLEQTRNDLVARLESLRGEIERWAHLADPHGGWNLTLEAVARGKEDHAFVEGLRNAEVVANLQRAASDRERLETRLDGTQKQLETRLDGTQKQLETRLDEEQKRLQGHLAELSTELKRFVELANPHGGWSLTLEAVARAKEIHPFVEELRAADVLTNIHRGAGDRAQLHEGQKHLEERLTELAAELRRLVELAHPHGGWEYTLQMAARFKENIEFLNRIKKIDYEALAEFFASLRKENLVLRMKRLERTLRDLEKTYRVVDLLDRFKSEQKLLLE